ncbi:outer membrane protein assembly factor [Bizionia argentinensis JUB59]|uniref:Outer membrane protein assembly factor n=1 Tax=Bizionia argentinensis JUB59 TaxID=1046627 RepID=G2EBW2_9FLAO|nr:BamA/TamA family outer membrane protein [Bizionia argentinensis]EGV44071.2 outer membrane protein assembly factor [Bizionia argentinensis JUB59]
MRIQSSKIAFYIVLSLFLASCSTIKRVGEDEQLLTKNTVYVNDKVNNSENINNLLYQKANRKLLTIPIRLHIYNLARPDIDSILEANITKNPKRERRLERFLSRKQLDEYIASRIGINKWLKKTGEAPIILNPEKTKRSINRLEAYYFHNGWFTAKAESETIRIDSSRSKVDYFVNTGDPYMVDSLTVKISSPEIDTLYRRSEKKSRIQLNKQYKTVTFEQEKDRLNKYFRNSGVYHFSEDYVYFEMDTIDTNKKVKVELQIRDRLIKNQDSSRREPFKIYKVKDVNIFTDYSYNDRNKQQKDSATYKGYNLFSNEKLRFKPKALTDAVFITPDSTFRDKDRTMSYRHISELRTFKYPNIEYIENADTTLTANVFLTPLKKFGVEFSAEVSQSNIQTIGLSFNPSVLMRNVFGGAETLQLTAFGSIGSSKDAALDQDDFFDINEWGADLKLTIPRLLLPFNTTKFIPKSMSPSTRMSISTSSQTNIGLDKQNLIGTLNYRWKPNEKVTNRFDLFSIQYVKNLNPDNYFNVYSTSYNILNDIAQDVNYIGPNAELGIPGQANTFIQEAASNNPPFGLSSDNIQNISYIGERQERLTENNLIIASSYNYIRDNRTSLFDENFSIFRGKIESAGNLLSLGSKAFGAPKNINDNYEVFDVAYSQYIKTELDYIKHWDLGKKQVLALRTFFGIAIPYGNSNSIPFSKSFFAGGTNDNRAWTAYSLGPGSSDSNDEFNEANMKLAFNLEYRFNIFEDFYGALFADAGNIWNALDNIEDPQATFTGFQSLEDIALGTGFGLRYDFGFIIFRFDVGFKTYDPSYPMGERWLNDYNFRKAVYNIGINYPF